MGSPAEDFVKTPVRRAAAERGAIQDRQAVASALSPSAARVQTHLGTERGDGRLVRVLEKQVAAGDEAA